MSNYRQWHREAGAEFDIALAEENILQTYGDEVSVWEKHKALRKFGTNSDIDTAATETIWEFGGDETYIFDNLIDTISSSSASDVGQVIHVEGHTITGTEANPQYTFVVQTATINGQNKVVLDTPLARCNRMFNTSGTELVGTVYAYQDSAITAGVPNDSTLVHAAIAAGLQQSRKAATTFSNSDYFIMTRIHSSVRRAGLSVADVFLEIREPGGVFRERLVFTAARDSGAVAFDLSPPVIVPKNSDVRMRAAVTANNTSISGFFGGYLARVKPNV